MLIGPKVECYGVYTTMRKLLRLTTLLLGFCNATWGLTVRFLLRCSVLFTVESLSCFISLLYLDLYVLGEDALIS